MSRLLRGISRTARYSFAGLVFLFFALLFQYYPTTIHEFEKGKPFHGDFIYNPYERLDGNWQRANFHTHSRAWKGITNGSQSPEEVVLAYQKAGYNVLGISNYQRIDLPGHDDKITLVPAYEHGYNIRKTHQVVLDAQETVKHDYIPFQGLNQKQSMIESLVRKSGGHVVLAHPKFFDGYKVEEMQYLTGYTFLEVLNHYRQSDEYWDAALSSGKLCWMLADDDCHDISRKSETFRMWNMIASETNCKEEVMESMTRGAHYGVHMIGGEQPNFLDSVTRDGSAFTLFLSVPADSILIIGQGGRIRYTSRETSRITFLFGNQDTYLRAVAYNGKGSLWLNPLVRYNGRKLPLTAHSGVPANQWLTVVHSVIIVAMQIVLLHIFFLLILGKVYYRRVTGPRITV
jgi:hypothetical protein